MAEAAALAAALPEKAAREAAPGLLEAARAPRARMAPGALVVARVRHRAVALMRARRSAAAKVAYRMAGENMPARIAPRLPTMVRSGLAVSEC